MGREERCVVGDELCEAIIAEQQRGNDGARATIAPDEPCPTTNYLTAQTSERHTKWDLLGVRSRLLVAFRLGVFANFFILDNMAT